MWEAFVDTPTRDREDARVCIDVKIVRASAHGTVKKRTCVCGCGKAFVAPPAGREGATCVCDPSYRMEMGRMFCMGMENRSQLPPQGRERDAYVCLDVESVRCFFHAGQRGRMWMCTF